MSYVTSKLLEEENGVLLVKSFVDRLNIALKNDSLDNFDKKIFIEYVDAFHKYLDKVLPNDMGTIKKTCIFF